MADNFNLRAFLTENKLTKNAKLLKEGTVINGKPVDMSSIEIDGIDTEDYPDFSDAYIAYATFEDGTELTDGELQELEAENYGLVNDLIHDDQLYLEEEVENDGEQANDIEQAQHDMERGIDAQVEGALQESRLTAKERRLVEMVQDALDTEGYGTDNINLQRKKQGLPPVQGPKYSEAVSEEEGNVDYTMGNQDDPNQLPNPPEELHIPTYKTIEELMKEIEHGTNEAAHTYKMNRMKEVAEALETKVGSLEEGEHAEHIDQKAVKQMRKDIAALRKAEEKLRKEFDKKFNKKEKGAAPKKEVEAEKPTLQENKNTMENFDLRKFLTENKMTTNSRMLNENADIQQAFSEAGLTGIVTVLFQSDSSMGEPDITAIPAERALRLVAKKAANAESVIVVQANEITQGEQIGDYEEETEGLTCKLIVEILDKGVYEIWQ